MEAGRQRALVRKATVAHKQQQGGSSTSAFKVVTKETLKRKNDGKDDRLNKKGTSSFVGDKQSKHPSPPKPSHGVRKSLMMGKGPVAPNAVCRMLTHKDYAVEMVDSIIKETDLDPYTD